MNENPTYRYPGVKPFEPSEAALFFGRDYDIENLLDLIWLEKIVVLFGKSGYGKSSLLNAGILPRLEDVTPIMVRFGASVEGAPSPLETVRLRLGEVQAAEALDTLEPATSKEETLWRQVKQKQSRPKQRFLFVFDQFEEFFSYPPAAQSAFKEQLAELLYTELPQDVRNRMESLNEAQQAFLATPFDAKVVFAVRADRLALLDSMKDRLPAILHKRYELRALSRVEAESALLYPAALEGDFWAPPFTFAPDATHCIFDFLEDEQKRIDPIQLQILAESFELRVLGERLRNFDAANLGDLKAVIARYYSDKIAAIENADERLAARRLCEEGLSQESDPPVRLSLYEAQISQYYGIGLPLLERMVNSRLLRAEAGAGGGRSYELPHDTLLEPVLDAKRQRLLEEKAAAEALEKAAAARQLAEAQQQAAIERRRRMTATTLSIASIIGLAVAVWFYFDAEKAKGEAEAQRVIAEERTMAAQKSDSLAQVEKHNAEEKARAALRSDSIAQLEKKNAETAAAEAHQKTAELEREKAERNRIEVEKYLSSARRMLRRGDAIMAKRILLEAQKLDRKNPEVVALLKTLN